MVLVRTAPSTDGLLPLFIERAFRGVIFKHLAAEPKGVDVDTYLW